MQEKLNYTIVEAAQVLSISAKSVWRMVWDGSIPSVKLGRRRVIPVHALRRWNDRETTRQNPE